MKESRIVYDLAFSFIQSHSFIHIFQDFSVPTFLSLPMKGSGIVRYSVLSVIYIVIYFYFHIFHDFLVTSHVLPLCLPWLS